jgi:hypothetical protein
VVDEQDDERGHASQGSPGDDPSEQHPAERYPRLVGLGLVLVSAALAKWQIYDPLHAAERGQTTVWLSGKLVTLAISLGLCGLALLVLGTRANRWFEFDPQNLGWKPVLVLGGVAVLCLAIYIVVELTLAAHGYSRSEF